MFPDGFYPGRYYPGRYYQKTGAVAPVPAYFAHRYFAHRYWPSRYFPPLANDVVSEGVVVSNPARSVMVSQQSSRNSVIVLRNN